MINKLKEINEKLIQVNINNSEELKKQELIKRILEEKNSFLKMDIETAYQILDDLQIPREQMSEIYSELINPPEELSI